MRPRLGLLGVAVGLVVIPAGVASAANVASPSVNVAVRAAATTSSGTLAATNSLNDGVNANTNAGSLFVVPTQIPGAQTRPGSRGFGYDLGGTATIDSFDLSQHVGGSTRGARARLQNVIVHTAGGSFPFTLPNQDDVTITLPAPVTTSWVTIETNTQHDGDDPMIGIDELAVNAPSGLLGPRPANLAAGRAVTLLGSGWTGTGDLTDNLFAAANGDLSTGRYHATPTAAGVAIDIDLGGSQSVNVLGLAEADYSGAGGRRLAQNVRLQFSDDPAFALINATRDLALSNIPYQQEEFAPATGRYVRLSVLSQFDNRDATIGITEIQLFAVPEPTALGLVLPAAALLMRRRR